MSEVKFVVLEPKKVDEKLDIEKAYKNLMKTIDVYEYLFVEELNEELGQDLEEIKHDITKSLGDFKSQIKRSAATRLKTKN